MDLSHLLNLEILSPNPISTVCDRPTVIQVDGIISISDYDNDVVTIKGNDKELHNSNPSVLDFESTYGFIPDRIACDNIAFNKSDIGTVISPKA